MILIRRVGYPGSFLYGGCYPLCYSRHVNIGTIGDIKKTAL